MQKNQIKALCILRIISTLILTFTLPSCALFGTAEQAESIFLDAEASHRTESYNTAIEKYQATLKEFRKPGVALGLRPHINKNLPTLINYRIAVCYVKLAEQSDNAKRFYNKAIEYAEKAAILPFETQPKTYTSDYHNYTIYGNLTITYENYQAQSYLLWGELLYITGKFELAIKKFSEFVAYFPDSPFVEEASYRIGVFYHKQGKHELSQIAFKQITNKFPSSRFRQEAHYRVAKLLLNKENYEQAYQEFTRSLKSKILSPDFQEEALYYAAYCLYQLGRYYAALNRYTTFITRYPKSQHIAVLPQYTFSMGKLYFGTKQYKGALFNYQSALQNTENQLFKIEIRLAMAEAHLAVGKAYFERKDYENALSAYQLALQNTEKQSLKIEIRLAMAEAHLAIGKVYFEKKDYENALFVYQLALQNTEKPLFKTKIQLATVFAYLNHGDVKNAIATCKHILSVTETDIGPMLTVDPTTGERLTVAKGIQLYLEAENSPFLAGYKGAVAKYNAALTEIQKSISTTVGAEYQTDLNYILGKLFYKVERFESAERQLTKAIKDFPDSNFVDDAWYAIGEMNYKLQSYTECRNAFRKILEIFPNSDLQDDAQYFIAKSLLEELDYEGAYLAFDGLTTKMFQKHLDFQDDAKYHAAYCLNLLGRDDMAIRRYSNLLADYPQSSYRVDAHFDLGTIYARQQDYENARINYALAMQHTDDQALLSEIQMAIGHAYYNQGDYKNAIVAHTSLLEKYQESDFILETKLGIANSHFRMEAWQEAAGAYKSIINEHPEATKFIPYCAYQIGEAHYGLATHHNDQGRAESAVENFHQALAWYQKIIDDLSTKTSDNLGEITELLITSLTRMRNDPSISEKLQSLAQVKKGDSYLATKQYGKALGEYNTFVQAFPNSTQGPSVRARINQVQEYIISKNLQKKKVRTPVQVPIAQQIARKALASTVLILIKNATGDPMAIGSGFFINKDQIVSNWHVIEGATTVYALSIDEKTRYNIEGILAMNPKQDLVILKVSGEGKPLSLGNSSIGQIGESIYVTGNPKGWTGTFSIGVISSFPMRYAGKRIQITAPVSPGSSGGPVLNNKGEVIGIVYALHGGWDAQNLNLAIPVSYLKTLLKRVGPLIPLSAR